MTTKTPSRFLLIGDIHARDRAPRGANEPYLDDLLDLLQQAKTLGIQEEIDAMVWAGDVFHEKSPSKTSHATVLRLIEYIRTLPFPLYILPGNHDISNDRLDSIDEKQPLGILYHSGARRLDGFAQDPALPLYGIPWQSDWHEEGHIQAVGATFRKALKNHNRHLKDSPVLIVTHASIYPPGQEPPFDVLSLEELSKALEGASGPSVDSRAVSGPLSVYYGHIHEDHGIFTVNNTTFCNVGALSRGSVHDYNVQREIKVAIWDSETGFSEHVLDYRPAEEALRLTEHEAVKAAEFDLKGFLSSIGTRTLEITTTGAVIAHIQAMKGVEEPVKRRAIALLEEQS